MNRKTAEGEERGLWYVISEEIENPAGTMDDIHDEEEYDAKVEHGTMHAHDGM